MNLVNAGDRIGLIGVNGSGKTTLLRIIAGLEPPDAGTVTVWSRVRIQYLPQEPRLDHLPCSSVTSDDEEAAFQCVSHLNSKS